MVSYKYYWSIVLSSLLAMYSCAGAGSLSNDIKKEMNASVLQVKIVLTFLAAASATCLTVLPAGGTTLFLGGIEKSNEGLKNAAISGGLGLVTVGAVAVDIALWKKWAQLIKRRMELKGYESFVGYLLFSE